VKPEIVRLFPTPLVLADIPGAQHLNAELAGVIRRRQCTHPSERKSNLGGWQSSDDMDRWGGAAAVKLLALARNLANQVTTNSSGVRTQVPYPDHFAVTWIGSMWANVNRSGDANDFHSHPGSYWSGVYYVDDARIGADTSLGGELEFLDPRGTVPLMNAPHLRMSGGISAGALEAIAPKNGRMLIFPAWLLHRVRPYRGDGERISIAFNLAV
jgi:uncharacterized protein (TIGR02466 family)